MASDALILGCSNFFKTDQLCGMKSRFLCIESIADAIPYLVFILNDAGSIAISDGLNILIVRHPFYANQSWAR